MYALNHLAQPISSSYSLNHTAGPVDPGEIISCTSESLVLTFLFGFLSQGNLAKYEWWRSKAVFSIVGEPSS